MSWFLRMPFGNAPCLQCDVVFERNKALYFPIIFLVTVVHSMVIRDRGHSHERAADHKNLMPSSSCAILIFFFILLLLFIGLRSRGVLVLVLASHTMASCSLSFLL